MVVKGNDLTSPQVPKAPRTILSMAAYSHIIALGFGPHFLPHFGDPQDGRGYEAIAVPSPPKGATWLGRYFALELRSPSGGLGGSG